MTLLALVLAVVVVGIALVRLHQRISTLEEQIEDRSDFDKAVVAEFRARLAGETPIPWADVRRRLDEGA